jgi:fucose permease
MPPSAPPSDSPRGARRVLVALAFVGFASLGLPDGALGVAWPSLRASFALPLDALGALLAATVCSYAGASFCAGALLARVNVGTLLAGSCAATGATLLGYWAAPSWSAMVSLGVVAGLGAGAIDAGINAFAATNFRPRTLHWLHAAYGLGTSTGPLLMAHSLMSGAGWRGGYLALGAIQLALAGGFVATRRRWPAPTAAAAPARRDAPPQASGANAPAVAAADAASAPALGAASAAPATAAPLRDTLRLRGAQLGALAFFLYPGVEATAGAWLFSLLESRGFGMATATAGVSAYWGGLFAGRVAFGFVPDRWRADALLTPAIVGCALAALGLAASLGADFDIACAALLGFAAAPIFPALIGATPERVGPGHTANVVGFQVAAAALGQAGLPALVGFVAARTTLAIAPCAIAAFALSLLAVNACAARLARATPR